MNDETALTIVTESSIAQVEPALSMAEAATLAQQYTRAAKLTKYQKGLRPETLRRQKTDLRTFADFLESIGVEPGDFYNDLDAWAEITADLIETFIDWQKRQGYAIGSINVRLATVKAYCHLAFSAGKLDTDTHTHIQGVKGIQRKQARNIDAGRETKRVGDKKAEPLIFPWSCCTDSNILRLVSCQSVMRCSCASCSIMACVWVRSSSSSATRSTCVGVCSPSIARKSMSRKPIA